MSNRTFKISRYRELAAKKNSFQRPLILISSRKAKRVPENLNKITIPIFERRKQDYLGNYNFVSPPSVLGKRKACLRRDSSNKN